MKYLFYILLLTFTTIFISCNNSGNKENLSATATDTLQHNGNQDTAAVRTIVFFGNSLSAGYGLEPDEAFPALIQKKIDSLGLNYNVVNAGLSGETTASGKNRVEWILKQPVDVFILELGGNDGLRGIPLDETKRNLLDIISTVRENRPDVKIVLAGMQIPPNMGPDYTQKFKEVYPEVAKQTGVQLIPFLLEGVGGEANFNLPDGIHPNVEGHKIVAENVWNVLEDVL